mgnify:CR=1 FL=1
MFQNLNKMAQLKKIRVICMTGASLFLFLFSAASLAAESSIAPRAKVDFAVPWFVIGDVVTGAIVPGIPQYYRFMTFERGSYNFTLKTPPKRMAVQIFDRDGYSVKECNSYWTTTELSCNATLQENGSYTMLVSELDGNEATFSLSSSLRPPDDSRSALAP